MKFHQLLKTIILEATPEQIYGSYYSDIPFNTFRQIVLSDPGTLKNGQEIKKIGKYSKLLLSMYKNGNLKMEDLPKATQYLSYVYKHTVSIDFNKIKTLPDLYNIVKQYYTKDAKDLKDVLKSLTPNDFESLFQDEKWTILKPKTEKGACYLGVNTEWCTTWGSKSLNPDFKGRSNRFDNHNVQGPLYIIINNKDLNEKYQFHFETKQYEDVNGKKIDTGSFFEKNIGVRDFFFPSFTKPNMSDDEISSQINRMGVLSSSDSTDLIEIVLEKVAQTNKLIRAISTKNEKEINNLIKDKDLGDDTEVYGEMLTFTFKFTFKERLSDDLQYVSDVLSYYEGDKQNSWDRLYDEISNEDSEWKERMMMEYFEEYYKIEKNRLNSDYGIINYEQFKSNFFEDFLEDNGLKEAIESKYVEINGPSYESELESRINEIEKYISFGTTGYRGYTTVYVTIGHFLLFLSKKNIQSISDNVEELLSEYTSYYNIDNEYEGVYGFNQRNPKYDEVSFEIEKYFDNIFDEYNEHTECNDLRIKLKDTIQKIFKGETTFENDIVKIEIPSLKVDCDDKTVFIKFTNKQTSKTEEGYVKIENLPSYVTNYKLFENILSFNRFK